MKTIWKFTLAANPEVDHVVSMPIDAVILKCGGQDGQLVLWATVDSGEVTKDRHFRIRGTGWDCEDVMAARYVDTVQMTSGFVWHVFEVHSK